MNSWAQRACIAGRPPAAPGVVAVVNPRNVSRNGVEQHAIARDSVHGPLSVSDGCSMMPVIVPGPVAVHAMQLPPDAGGVARPPSGEPEYEPHPSRPDSTVPPSFFSVHEKSIHAPFAGTEMPLAASWYSP